MEMSAIIRVIQAVLAPAIMINAIGLLLLSTQNKYGRIVDRIRQFDREGRRLRAAGNEAGAAGELEAVERQMPDLLRRLKLQHDTVQFLFRALIVFIADLFVIAAGMFASPALFGAAALVVFLTGEALLLYAALLAAAEIRVSHRAVSFEASRFRDFS